MQNAIISERGLNISPVSFIVCLIEKRNNAILPFE